MRHIYVCTFWASSLFEEIGGPRVARRRIPLRCITDILEPYYMYQVPVQQQYYHVVLAFTAVLVLWKHVCTISTGVYVQQLSFEPRFGGCGILCHQ